ncbi:MAG: APC family permease [Armatimonadetes bacterium]|nr:APC family permease [Armatimonadota bacterium]
MATFTSFRRFLVGKPIATKYAHHEKLPKLIALPVFASDALSSVAYATEEIMHIFRVNNAMQLLQLTLNISIVISILIAIVSLSYFQTIYAYPSGGGSYTVAKNNLGEKAGMVAGAALLIDYVLTVSVSISAGVAAIVSLDGRVQPYVVPLCVFFIGIITIANLRGAKESGALFAIPTYSFILLLLILMVKGLFTAGTPMPPMLVQAHSGPPQQFNLLYVWLLMRAFAAGCTALTGIEAVSNGTSAFKDPVSKNASVTLLWMAIILGVLFIGMSFLAEKFHAIPMEYGEQGFKTVVAQIASTVFGGNSVFFKAVQIATAMILILAANTAYADFPRLASILARDGFVPRQLAAVGDRLVFQNGIIVLAVLATILVVVFHGDTSSLIPLYAVGVFLCFTLSQFGMVIHEKQNKRPFWSVALSFIGGIITGIVTIVIFSTKFKDGAWIVMVAATAILIMFTAIRKHYNYLADQLNLAQDDNVKEVTMTALLLVPRVHRGILKAIAYARAMATDVRAIHVTLDKASAEKIKSDWAKFGADIPLVILESPYRSLVEPITEYIDQSSEDRPNHFFTVIVPQAIPKVAWHSLLHTNAAVGLKLALASRKNVIITNVRYFLS